MVSALCVMKLHNHLIIANLLVRTTIIDVDTITSIVADLSSSEEDLAQESVQVFHLQLIHIQQAIHLLYYFILKLMDSFSLPKLCYDERQKSFRM